MRNKPDMTEIGKQFAEILQFEHLNSRALVPGEETVCHTESLIR